MACGRTGCGTAWTALLAGANTARFHNHVMVEPLAIDHDDAEARVGNVHVRTIRPTESPCTNRQQCGRRHDAAGTALVAETDGTDRDEITLGQVRRQEVPYRLGADRNPIPGSAGGPTARPRVTRATAGRRSACSVRRVAGASSGYGLSPGSSARRMQNSLPSGSAMTTHDTASVCPTSTLRAPSASARVTSSA